MKKISFVFLLGVSFVGAAHHSQSVERFDNNTSSNNLPKSRGATTVGEGQLFLLWATILQKGRFCDVSEPGWLKRHREVQTKMDQEKQSQNTPKNQQGHRTVQDRYRFFTGTLNKK